MVTILEAILKLARTYIFNETTNRIDLTVGSEVINHLLRLPQNYFDKRPVGELGTKWQSRTYKGIFYWPSTYNYYRCCAFDYLYFCFVPLQYLANLTIFKCYSHSNSNNWIGGPIFKYQHRETTKLNAITQNHLVESITGIQNVKTQNIENTIGSKCKKTIQNI